MQTYYKLSRQWFEFQIIKKLKSIIKLQKSTESQFILDLIQNFVHICSWYNFL